MTSYKLLCFMTKYWYFWGNITLFYFTYFNSILWLVFCKWTNDYFGLLLAISPCLSPFNVFILLDPFEVIVNWGNHAFWTNISCVSAGGFIVKLHACRRQTINSPHWHGYSSCDVNSVDKGTWNYFNNSWLFQFVNLWE